MVIQANQLSKKYYSRWIIHDFSYDFLPARSIAIKGKNGSGKSTLLQLLSSVLSPTSGTVNYLKNDENMSLEQARFQISLCSLAAGLPKDMTVEELVSFHYQFHRYIDGFHINKFLNSVWLANQRHLQIKELSTGMTQRLRIGLTLFSAVEWMLFDEPTSHLDEEGVEWFHDQLQRHRGRRGLMIASNEERDFQLCEESIYMNELSPMG